MKPHPAEKWLDLHGDALYRFALLHVGDPDLAGELVQQSLFTGLENYGHFEGRSQERSWLIGILKNKILEHFRKASRKENLGSQPNELDEYFYSLGPWKRPPSQWDRPPSEILENKEFFKSFEACLAKLPAAQRQAFALRELDGLDSKNICKVLGIRDTHLWVLLHRARLQLRQCLGKNWFGEEK